MEKLFCCGSEYIKSTLPLLKNDFWKDVFKALWKFELLLEVDFEKNHCHEMPIFYNKYLKIGSNSFFIKHGLIEE